MKDTSELTEVSHVYAAAYNAHYSAHEWRLALQLHRKLLVSRSDTPEAGYARIQVRSIAIAVVPERERSAAQIDLALKRLQHYSPQDIGQTDMPSAAAEAPH